MAFGIKTAKTALAQFEPKHMTALTYKLKMQKREWQNTAIFGT